MTAMREIRFRGFNGEKWLYGDLNIDYKTKQATISDDRWWRHPVRFDTVGQYTGLKDCKGREIYEGDIVRFELPPMVLTNEKTAVGAVVYEYGQFLVIIHAMRFTIFSVINDCTVVGNIHDNPDLLEATE